MEVIPHTSVKYVGRVLDWDLSELGRTDKTVARDNANGPIKVSGRGGEARPGAEV